MPVVYITADYIIPSDNWEQQHVYLDDRGCVDYIIPSDNWEQQRLLRLSILFVHYIIPSDNWEQQQERAVIVLLAIISYQAITGNNNRNGQ